MIGRKKEFKTFSRKFTTSLGNRKELWWDNDLKVSVMCIGREFKLEKKGKGRKEKDGGGCN